MPLCWTGRFVGEADVGGSVEPDLVSLVSWKVFLWFIAAVCVEG